MIGPTRLNYARIVPMVDYTAQMVEPHAALTPCAGMESLRHLIFGL